MPLINAYALKRPDRPTRTFTAKPENGETLTLSLQRLSNPRRYKAMARAQEMTAKYLEGDPQEGIPPMPFPTSYDGDRPELSPELFQEAAVIECMQVGEGYAFADLIHIADALEESWQQLVTFCRALNAGARVENVDGEPEKKASPPSVNSTTDTLSPSASINLETIPS